MAIDAPELIDELRNHLFDWLPRQAWFDAHESEVAEITVIRTEVLRRQWPLVMWVPLEVEIDGAPVICQTVLALAPVVPDVVPGRAILGEVPSSTGPVMAYDALADPEASAAFVEHVADGLGATSNAVTDLVDEPWLTTIELANDWEVTLYRRVQSGPHPDVELTTLLAPDGRQLTRPPVAVWRKNHHDLATLRRRVRRSVSGAELCRASVTELLARRCQPRENPLDVVEQLGGLGRGLAALHVGLADHLGSAPGVGDRLAVVLGARLPRQLDELAAARVAATYRRLAFADDLGRFIRIHGNLDLAAVEHSRGAWTFSRFGCNPDSDLLLDQEPLTPLADLAGLLHGIGRCAAAALDEAMAQRSGSGAASGAGSGDQRPGDDDDEAPDFYEQAARRELAVLAEAWEERGVDAVIAGYTSNDEVHRLLPVERISRDALLTLFELELGVRDRVRELDVGPQVLRIPVEAIDELAAASVRARW